MTIFLNTVQHFVLLSLCDYLAEDNASDDKVLKGEKKKEVISLMRKLWSYKGNETEKDEDTAKILDAMVKETLEHLKNVRDKIRHPQEGWLESRLRAIQTVIAAILDELVCRNLSDITPELDPEVEELLTDPRLDHDPRISSNEILKQPVDLSYRYFEPRDIVGFGIARYFGLRVISNMSPDVRCYFIKPGFWDRFSSSSAALTEDKKKLMHELWEKCTEDLDFIDKKFRKERISYIITIIDNFLSKNEKVCQGNSYTASIPFSMALSLVGLNLGFTATPSAGYFAEVLQESKNILEAMKLRIERNSQEKNDKSKYKEGALSNEAKHKAIEPAVSQSNKSVASAGMFGESNKRQNKKGGAAPAQSTIVPQPGS